MIIILIMLKIVYDLCWAFVDFTNAITDKIRYVGVMLNRPDIKANIETVLLNIDCFQKISSATIEVSQTAQVREQK